MPPYGAPLAANNLGGCMPWFRVKQAAQPVEYRFSHQPQSLIFEYLAQGHWHITVQPWQPSLLHYKSLLGFYNELYSALQSGLQLKEAFQHLATANQQRKLNQINQAILAELSRGVSLNLTLSRLCHPQTQAFCQLINEHGAREDCLASLQLSINQLTALLAWSNRLLKALAYPCCIIQIALLMSLGNQFLLSANPDDQLANYGLVTQYLLMSLFQGLLISALLNGHACTYLEKYNHHFRLTKLFIIINTLRKSGVPFQQALQKMPNYFVHNGLKMDITLAYYSLKLGHNYPASFPDEWFPEQAKLALHSASKDGNIERALTLASQIHEQHWQRSIALFEKAIPLACLIIAAIFVANTLLSLYGPMLTMSP